MTIHDASCLAVQYGVEACDCGAKEAAAMTVHISRDGFEVDDDDFYIVRCDCGETIGPAPDPETVLDMAMEHAWAGGLHDANEAAKKASATGGDRA